MQLAIDQLQEVCSEVQRSHELRKGRNLDRFQVAKLEDVFIIIHSFVVTSGSAVCA